LEYKEPVGKVEKTKIKADQLSIFVRNWFPHSDITDTKIIYFPSYIITYSRKNQKRKIEINGITGNIIRGS